MENVYKETCKNVWLVAPEFDNKLVWWKPTRVIREDFVPELK